MRGRLLISKPFLDDPYFKRTVILLCDHDTEGSFGFILNKYTDIEFGDLNLKIPMSPGSLAIGGPVETQHIYYLHRLGEKLPGSIHIADDIYTGGDFQELTEMMKSDDFDLNDVRFFIGYSGWDVDQLEEELNLESWYVASADGIDFMNTELRIDDLWAQVLKTMGGDFVNLANFPEDPTLN